MFYPEHPAMAAVVADTTPTNPPRGTARQRAVWLTAAVVTFLAAAAASVMLWLPPSWDASAGVLRGAAATSAVLWAAATWIGRRVADNYGASPATRFAADTPLVGLAAVGYLSAVLAVMASVGAPSWHGALNPAPPVRYTVGDSVRLGNADVYVADLSMQPPLSAGTVAWSVHLGLELTNVGEQPVTFRPGATALTHDGRTYEPATFPTIRLNPGVSSDVTLVYPVPAGFDLPASVVELDAGQGSSKVMVYPGPRLP